MGPRQEAGPKKLGPMKLRNNKPQPERMRAERRMS